MNKNSIYIIGGGLFSILGILLFENQLFLKYLFFILGIVFTAYGLVKELKSTKK